MENFNFTHILRFYNGRQKGVAVVGHSVMKIKCLQKKNSTVVSPHKRPHKYTHLKLSWLLEDAPVGYKAWRAIAAKRVGVLP